MILFLDDISLRGGVNEASPAGAKRPHAAEGSGAELDLHRTSTSGHEAPAAFEKTAHRTQPKKKHITYPENRT